MKSSAEEAISRALWPSDKPVLWVTALVFLAFVLRTLRLDFQPLWWDEGWTVYFATADVPDMVARTAIDIHPPFYYLVLHLWTLITGVSATSVRLFSVMSGTLSIPLVYMVGRRLFGQTAGIMSALVMGLAPFHVYYSQEARMYALVALLVLACVYLFLRLLEGHRSGGGTWTLWVLYACLTAMAMYTQYYAAFVPLAFSLFIISRLGRYRGMLARWIVAHALLLLLYLPWLLYAGPRLVAYVGNKLVKEGDLPVGLWSYFRDHLVAFSVGHLSEAWSSLSWLAVVPVALAMLAVVTLLVVGPGLRDTHSERTEEILFVVMYMLAPLSLGYVVNLRYPFSSPGIERLFLLSAPAFFILVAVGLSWLRERWRVPWAVLAVLTVAVNGLPLLDFYTFARYTGEDYRPLVNKVQALARREDVVVAVHPWQLGYFQAYYRGQMPSLYLTPKQPTDVTSEQWAEDRPLMEQDLDQLLVEHRFLWFPGHQALGRIMESDVEGYLFASQYPILSEWYSDSTRLSCFAGADELQRVEAQTDFGGIVSLDGYALSSSPLEAGWGAVLADLWWTIDGQLPSKYQMALRLVDDQGREWASEDREPLGGLRPFHELPVGRSIADHQSVLVPTGTPPGLYRLELGLYRLQTGEWLEVRDQEGATLGVKMRLGVVEVRAPATPPPEESLLIQYPGVSDFACGVVFLGFSLGPGSFQPGDALDLTLFWKAREDVRGDYALSLRVEDQGGQVWASVEAPPATATYPTSHWTRGQLVRGIHRMMIPARVPPGQYRLVMGLHSAEDGSAVPLRRWLMNWGDEHVLGTVVVEGRAHETSPPASITHPVSFRLGDNIELLGYDLEKLDTAAGGIVHLTLYWHALAEVDGSYSVFNHLIGQDRRIWGQKDGVPGNGALPTSSWIAGEYVVDEYDIPVDQEAPSGEYFIESGMYDPQTMVRLPVFDAQGTPAGDRVLLEATPIQVR